MHKIVPYITARVSMQIYGILRYAISRKRPTVNTQQEDEDVFHLDTPGKSSSEAVKDSQPILLLVRASSPYPFPHPDPEVQYIVPCTYPDSTGELYSLLFVKI